MPICACSRMWTSCRLKRRRPTQRLRRASKRSSKCSSRSNATRRQLLMKLMRFIATAALLGAASTAAAQTPINGAGATFPRIIYDDWMLTYNQTHPDVKLNYQSIGSGGGIRQFSDGTVDFGASDAP